MEEASLATLERASQAVAERRHNLQQTPGFDAALASEHLDELQSQEPFAEEAPQPGRPWPRRPSAGPSARKR
ncbi:MAG: hypothetical protein WAT36_07780 [Chromatiaceae bacterium]